VALELRRLVEGDLAGMFDGPTSAGIDLSGALVVLDLSALYSSPALGLLMTCATAWLQGVIGASRTVRRLVVVDEAWAIVHDLAIARWLQSGFKLARAFGVANIAVVHRLSDLQAAGGAGSEQRQLAEGLLSDSETRVIFGQPHSEVGAARELLGLTLTEAELLPQLPRGVALWKVGRRSFLVEHRVGSGERRMVDTDARMRPSVEVGGPMPATADLEDRMPATATAPATAYTGTGGEPGTPATGGSGDAVRSTSRAMLERDARRPFPGRIPPDGGRSPRPRRRDGGRR
jgi:hypothetical protein